MINEAKIYLLDLDPSSDVGCTLEEIIASFPNSEVQTIRETLEDGESVLCDNEICHRILRSNSDMILFVLSSDQLELSKTLFQSISKKLMDLPIVIVFEACNSNEMFSMLKLGAADFITPPFKETDILPRLWRQLESKQKTQLLTHKLKKQVGLKQLIGESPIFLDEIKKIPIVATCDAGVLITGKTGTGKEMCARAIHYLSPRSSQPFIPFNCGAVPTELMENELFGHVQGAFTGAFSQKPGLIREANGGTLFLDDVDCLPLLAQVKLLRFLQEKEYRQLGSAKLVKADVRIIAATNTDFVGAVEEGKFRQDLYYRLNIIPLTLPSLRERQEDIPLLASYFIKKYAIELNKNVTGIENEALQVLMLHNWPGNVRELEHVIERAVLFSEHAVIRETDIIIPQKKDPAWKVSFQDAKSQVISQFEKNYVEKLLLAHQGNITKAAQAAQKNRRSFWELIRKHQIDVKDFKPA